MPTIPLAEYLPRVYQRILPEWFTDPIPVESEASCLDCVMLPGEEKPDHPRRTWYSSHTKCCTFFPSLPNYLVGAILSAETNDMAEGRHRVESAIAAGSGVYPHGLFPTPRQHHLYLTHGRQVFGRSHRLRCPYLDDDGRCTIRSQRNAICSCWFCRHVAGQDGRRFWSTVKNYLLQVEQVLTLVALDRLAWPPDEVARMITHSPPFHPFTTPLTAAELDDHPPAPARHRQVWGTWTGRETEWYRNCFRVVAELDGETFARLAGIQLTYYLAAVRSAWQWMASPTLPTRLRLNLERRIRRMNGGATLIQGSEGWVEIPADLWELLEGFDGNTPTEDILSRARDRESIELEDELMLWLYRKDILTAE